MSKALVDVIIIAGAVIAVAVMFFVRAVWVRAEDRLRTRALGVPFAGRVEICSAQASLVAPDVRGAVRDFRLSWWTKTFRRLVQPSGVLTVRTASGGCRLAWEPDAKSQRRGSRAWQLDQRDIEYIRINATPLDWSAFITVRIVDGSHVQVETVNAGPLRRVLAGTGITMFEGRVEKSAPAAPAPAAPPPAAPPPAAPAAKRSSRHRFLRPYSIEDRREQLARVEALMAVAREQLIDWPRQQLTKVPTMDGRTRTWADVADYLGMTQGEAWDVLKADPAEVARLGLPREGPHQT